MLFTLILYYVVKVQLYFGMWQFQRIFERAFCALDRGRVFT